MCLKRLDLIEEIPSVRHAWCAYRLLGASKGSSEFDELFSVLWAQMMLPVVCTMNALYVLCSIVCANATE